MYKQKIIISSYIDHYHTLCEVRSGQNLSFKENINKKSNKEIWTKNYEE
jgi:hypothetical protein